MACVYSHGSFVFSDKYPPTCFPTQVQYKMQVHLCDLEEKKQKNPNILFCLCIAARRGPGINRDSGWGGGGVGKWPIILLHQWSGIRNTINILDKVAKDRNLLLLLIRQPCNRARQLGSEKINTLLGNTKRRQGWGGLAGRACRSQTSLQQRTQEDGKAQKQPDSCSACGGVSSFHPAVGLVIRCALSIPQACQRYLITT